MPAQVIKLFPRGAPHGRHWVYLLGTADGIVKVGRTKFPRERLSSHRSGFKNVVWYHIGPCGDDGYSAAVEWSVIDAFRKIGQQIARTETFRGITKERAIAVLRTDIVNVPRTEAERELARQVRVANHYANERATHAAYHRALRESEAG